MNYEELIEATIGALHGTSDHYRLEGYTERADHYTELANRWQGHLNELRRHGEEEPEA